MPRHARGRGHGHHARTVQEGRRLRRKVHCLPGLQRGGRELVRGEQRRHHPGLRHADRDHGRDVPRPEGREVLPGERLRRPERNEGALRSLRRHQVHPHRRRERQEPCRVHLSSVHPCRRRQLAVRQGGHRRAQLRQDHEPLQGGAQDRTRL